MVARKAKSTKPVSPFKPKEVVTVAGFELRKYGSMLRRETVFWLQEKRTIYTKQFDFWSVVQQYAETAGISPQQAIDNIAASQEDVTLMQEVAPYLIQLSQSNVELEDPAEQEQLATIKLGYIIAKMMLASRLETAWIEKYQTGLSDTYDLSKAELELLLETEVSDRLSNVEYVKVFDKIVAQLDNDSLAAVVAFGSDEELGERATRSANLAQKDEGAANDPK